MLVQYFCPWEMEERIKSVSNLDLWTEGNSWCLRFRVSVLKRVPRCVSHRFAILIGFLHSSIVVR